MHYVNVYGTLSSHFVLVSLIYINAQQSAYFAHLRVFIKGYHDIMAFSSHFQLSFQTAELYIPPPPPPPPVNLGSRRAEVSRLSYS